MSLLRLPSVASTSSRPPQRTARMVASISFTVVLPLLPVIAATGSVKRPRQEAASRPSAASVSFTTTWGISAANPTRRATSAAAAPRPMAWGT